MIPLLLLVGVAAVALALAYMYNTLARLRLLASNAWADIDVQLKRRHDLVPMLVAAVRGHTGYERGTLEAVVAARNRAVAASGPASAGPAERALAGSVRDVFALAEAYPDLKAATSFLELQKSLTEIEDTIQQARRYYNAVVRDLNVKISQVPSNLVARLFGFREREFFGLDDASEAAAPSVDFGGTQ
jgi:LemA protein